MNCTNLGMKGYQKKRQYKLKKVLIAFRKIYNDNEMRNEYEFNSRNSGIA
jgi:hypothetical protein